MSPSRWPPLCALPVLALAALPAAADRLITHDGRILELEKARKLDGDQYLLVFESGEIRCPAALVTSVEIEGDMADYVPRNEDEREKLEQGYVRLGGKWMSKAAYQVELDREAARRRERTEELALHSRFPDGWEKETRHFRFKTNTSPELLEHYAELLETYHDLMDRRVGIRPSPTLRRTRMQVNIYRSAAEFRSYTQAAPGVAGSFDRIREELQFFHDYEDPELSEWVALHEGTHLLTYLIEPQSLPQIWINEAVADYFGSATITRDSRGRLSIEPGQPQYDRILTVQQAIEERRHVPLETLFFLEKNDFRGPEYAHAWSFVYFLNSTAHEKGFKRFFKDFYTIGKGVSYELKGFPNQQGTAKVIPPEEVRRLLLDRLKVKDTLELEAQWLDFVRDISIDAPRARFRRALRALVTGDFERGLEDVQAALDGGIDDPRAYWARGTLALIVKGDARLFRSDHEAAIARAPLEARYRNSLAVHLAGFARAPGGAASAQGTLSARAEDLAAAEVQFGLACELDPANDTYRESRDRFLRLKAAK